MGLLVGYDPSVFNSLIRKLPGCASTTGNWPRQSDGDPARRPCENFILGFALRTVRVYKEDLPRPSLTREYHPSRHDSNGDKHQDYSDHRRRNQKLQTPVIKE